MTKALHRSLIPLLLAVLLGGMPGLALSAEGRVPLVTIRFNQQDVRYEQDLFAAMEKAVKAKPEVRLEIVSRAPSTGEASVDGYWQRVAGANTRRVLQTLVSMGVPPERITVTGKVDAAISFDETQVFVL